MRRACLAVVDSGRARHYAYEEGAEDDPGHELREIRDLAHPEARDVIAELDQLVRAGNFEHVIVVASPSMLGALRRCDGVLHRGGIVVDEIPRDLAQLTSPQLHDHLAQLHVLPPRQRPGARSAAR